MSFKVNKGLLHYFTLINDPVCQALLPWLSKFVRFDWSIIEPKTLPMRLFILCLLSLLLGATLHAQDADGFDLFGVLTKPYGNKCSLITLDTLADAKTLGDLRRQYPESWVAEYLEVIIRSECGGEVRVDRMQP